MCDGDAVFYQITLSTCYLLLLTATNGTETVQVTLLRRTLASSP